MQVAWPVSSIVEWNLISQGIYPGEGFQASDNNEDKPY